MSSTASRWRYPLAVKLLTGLLLNFALIAVLFVALPGHRGAGWDLLLTVPVRERLLTVGEQVASMLAEQPAARWPALLEAESARRGVGLDTREMPGRGPPRGPPDAGSAGGPDRPPGERPPPPPGWPEGPTHAPPGTPSWGAPPGGPQTSRGILADMIAVERRGWGEGFGVRIPMRVQGRPVDLDVQTTGWVALLRFLGIADWLLFLSLCLIATALVWAPFAWGLTRAIGALTRATRTIAQGRFDVRVPLVRRDELGQLADSVNDMAARLERQVETQKQFVADVAHEVTAPLARLRVGLALLGTPDDPRSATVQAGLEEDAQQMSTLLDELLLFSRTGQIADREAAQCCALIDLVQAAADQEAPNPEVFSAIRIRVPADLKVQAPAALVQRALANLIRNALRYGQTAVEIEAQAIGGQVEISIRDRGPGVPENALARLGEPFYRPDFARNRALGGTGLGLAIVRRCVAAADGQVLFRNREGGGFEVLLRLLAASALRSSR